MSLFQSPPKPTHPLAYHRILSPSASVKVSPIALGGISIGSSWSSIFGRNEDSDKLLDAYFEIGGNFIDTSNSTSTLIEFRFDSFSFPIPCRSEPQKVEPNLTQTQHTTLKTPSASSAPGCRHAGYATRW